MPKTKILVADDETGVAIPLGQILISMGYEVVGMAFSGEEALEMTRRLKPDLILMDIVMPGKFDGIEASEIIRTELDIPVIFLTAYADEQFVMRAKDVEPFGYIAKPFQKDELKAAIEIALYKKDMEKQRLREKEEKYRCVVQQAVEAIYMFDPETKRVLEENSAFLNILGYKAGEVRTFTVYDFVAHDREDIDAHIGRVLTFGGVTIGERVWRRKDGTLLDVYVTAGKIQQEGRDIIFMVGHDITERKRTENELKRTTQELKQTVEELRNANQKILEQQKSVIEEERLKVLIQLAGATAHELNQPLTALLGNIELMRMSKDDPAELARYIERIEKAGERISDIVKRIQTIRYDETKSYSERTAIIDLDQRLNILAVENIADDFKKIGNVLKDHTQINLSRASNMGEAMQVLKNGQFDLILVNHVLPDGDSLDFLKLMSKKGLEIPVVVVTGQGDEIMASKVILAGAYDYLPKELINEKSLSRSIGNAVEKFHLKKRGQVALRRMAEVATRDELTGLYNRRFLKEALKRELARAKRYGAGLVILMMDLDHFKEINDTYGHTVGDMVLCKVGRMLLESMRQSDLVCRYGGEEFAVILPNTGGEEARLVCERFREKVSKHQFEYNSSKFQLTLSIGITSHDSSRDQSPLDLINNADQALYQAKREGRNRVRVAVS